MTNFTYFKRFFIHWAVSLALLLGISSFLRAQSPDSWEQKSDVGFTVPNGPKGRLLPVGFAIGSKGYIGTGYGRDGFTKDFWEFDPATNSWTQKADFGGISRDRAVGFSIGNKGYIGTGEHTKDFWEYDPLTNSWTQKADFGGLPRSSAVGFSIGSKGYIGTGSGGSGDTKDFWEYDPATDKWTQKADFGGGERIYAVGFCIGSKGYIGTGDRTKDFWEYDPATDKWTQKADFGGLPRSSAVGFSIGSKGYIGTGVDGNEYKNDFWEYDGSKWTTKANLGGTLREEAVGFSIGSKGYIGTGSDANDVYKNDFWEFDPATNSWTQKADFGGGARHRAVGFGINGKGYIGTGYNGTTLNDFWEFDPVNNKWTKKADFGGGARFAAVGFGIGSKGYIGTGSGDTNDFWEYDPVTDKWTKKADFGGIPRYNAVGFSIGSKGYIGTGDNFGYKNDFWEYDPATNSWTQKADFGGGVRQRAVGFGIGSKGYIGTGEYGDNKSDFWGYTPCTLSATITPAAAQSGCSGAALALSGSSTGGTSPTYAWSSSPSGFNSTQQNPAFTLPVVTSPVDYTLTLTVTEGGCSATTTKQITVNPVSAGGSIGGAATVCAGTNSIALTLSGNTGSIVKWRSSLSANFANPTDIVNTTTQLTATNLTQTTYYRAVVKSGVCDPANSASATVTVNPVSAGGSISGAATVCAGINSTILTLSEHMGTIVKWQSSLSANFANPTDIVNTTTQLTATNLTQTTYYRAVVKSGVCEAVNSAAATVTVNPVSVGGSIGGAATVCAASNSTVLTLSEYTGSIVKWQSADNVNFANATDIGNTTMQLTAINLTQTTYYRAVVKSGVCEAVHSATATITVNPVSVGGTVTGSAKVCTGTNSIGLTLSEHTGTIVKWQSSLSANFTNPTDIANTTTQLTATNLTQTTYYRVVVKSGVCDVTNSASATVTVNPLPTAMLSGTAVVCLNSPTAQLTFTGSNGTAPYTFTYTLNNGTEQTLTTTGGNSALLLHATNAAGTFVFSLLRVSDANECGQALSDRDTVTVPAPAVPTNPTAATISQGQSATLTANGCAGPGFALLWYKSSDNSQMTMPVSPTTTTSYYARCQQTAGQTSCLSGNSVSVTVTVGQRIFVNITNATPDPDGKSWATAFPSLQTALAAARNAHYLPLEVWVAKGTYLPGTLRKDVFSIPSGVKVYGGFVGTETLLSERHWKTNETILSGEIGTVNKNDNSHHVVLFQTTNDSTRLDGFTVRGGYAEFYSGSGNVNLNDPEILSSGGGILAVNKSKGMITNCVLTDNRASGGAGILLRDSSHLQITQSIIWGNQANFGGGIYVLGGSQPQLENVLIVNNKGLGGGLYVNQSQPTLVNCTIASNKDEGNNAGGILNTNAITTVKNSIFWGNSPLQSNGGSVITYSIVEGGYAGTGNKSLNPQFVSPNSVGLAPLGSLGDYHLQACSPGIDAGDNAVAPLADLEKNARPYPSGIGIADMGVYESQSSGTTGPNHLSVTENITSGTVLKAGTWITATNQVANATVVYQGSKSVILTPDFSATVGEGNSFLAKIGGCP